MRNTIITGIVLIVIGGLITKFVFNDKIELRYVVSNRIPTNFFDGNESESIQQLELLNNGDVELQRIIIKIKTNVIEYYIQKVTSSDSIVVSKTNGMLEILYPQIPPDGNIKIIIKSIGNGITNNDLDIKHSRGSAKEALETNNSLGFFSLGLFLLYFLFVIYGIRTMAIDSLANNVYYHPYEKILKKSKPWYVSLSKWKTFRKDSLKFVFDNEYFSNIINALCYQILDTQKQSYLSEEEWIRLKLIAQEKLINLISENVNKGFYWKMDEFISLKRPRNIDDDVWKEIKSLLSKSYTTTLILSINDYNNQEEMAELLMNTKPDMIDESDWKKYQSFLQKYINLKKQTSINHALRDEFANLLYGKELKEKPEELSIKDWESLKKIETEIFKKSHQLSEKLSDLEKIKIEIIPLKEKLESQLRIINEVLNDPTTINRIEDYANPFSSGNFENLKLVAELKGKK